MRTEIFIPTERLAEFCRRWKIVELPVFGSALGEDFRPDSDLDLLVRVTPDADCSLPDHVAMEEELTLSSGERWIWFRDARSSGAPTGSGARPSWSARSHTLPRDDAHLLDILKAARLTTEFKGFARKVEFLGDAKTQSAILHQLLIIGGEQENIAGIPGGASRGVLEADRRDPRLAPDTLEKQQAIGGAVGLRRRGRRQRLLPPGGGPQIAFDTEVALPMAVTRTIASVR